MELTMRSVVRRVRIRGGWGSRTRRQFHAAPRRLEQTGKPTAPMWSYVCGESSLPLLGTTIGKLLETAADKFGSRDAFVSMHQNLRYSHEQLLEQSDRLAAGLLALGLKKGDRVGIWSPNCMEWIVTQYATARAGLILVNVNPAYRAFEMEYAMRKVGVKALIAAENFKDTSYHQLLLEIIPELEYSDPGRLDAKSLPDMTHVIMLSDQSLPGTHRYKDVTDMGSSELMGRIQDNQDLLQFDEPINIQFTSGTTGNPKGVMLSHHTIVNNAQFVGSTMQYNMASSVCLPVPMYHCFGMVLGSLTVPIFGGCVVLPSATVEPEASLQAVHQERCTALYGTPTMFIDMLASPNLERYDLTSLHTGIMAGVSCPVEVMKQVREKLHMPDVTIAYGCTENSPVTFQTLMNSPVEKRVGTVGTVLPYTEAKIVDEHGRIVPRGSPGEIYIRGYCNMLAYWGDPDKTAEVMGQDRWYKTGDVSVMDEEGYVQIVGRSKDMINRGGENIYPVEVEQFLYTHPQIEDVQVIGVPDERLGEDVCAWIKLKAGETATTQDIKTFCKGKISHFKIPRYIEFVTDFPKTVTGKVQKYKMKEVMRNNMQSAKDTV